jgi:hypothetical protein
VEEWKSPPSTSPRWNLIWHKSKAQNEPAFFWSVNHNAIIINEWHGKFSTEIDKSYPLCSPQLVELVEHKFYSCPFAQHHLATLCQKRQSQPMEVIFYVAMYVDQPLCKTLIRCSQIWFFLRNNLPWIILRQQNDYVFNNCIGPLKKNVKSFGMPCMIMGGLNESGHSRTWK